MEIELDNDVSALEEGLSEWTGTYTWQVKNWTKLTEKKIYSPEFEIGTYTWRLVVFPRGNDSLSTSDYISLYLEAPEASFTPLSMCPTAKFELTAAKESNPDDSMTREATHSFAARAEDWGFAQFIPFELVGNPQNGYLVDDILTFHLNLAIQNDDQAVAPPKRDITFVGLKNQGDGGYLNSLLQCLFHIGSFRKAIYQMPASGQEASKKSILRAMQSLFYQLQHQNSVVDASELGKAMGWESNDAISQHDLQKMHSTLLGALNQHTINRRAQSVTSSLFRGRAFQCMHSFNVQYASTWKQAYTEIPLDVMGCKDIYESLEKFCKFRGLKGTKQHDASGSGLVDTKQGAFFESFPPVLQFHLKRFFCDSDRNVMLKISSRHEFYDELDLDSNGCAFLDKNADKTTENKYKLHSVIAHRDGPNGGHYFAFIRPNEKWYKFDDENVEEVSAEDAINKQFGSNDGAIIETIAQDEEEEATYSMACTLVYIRQSEWERIMCEAGKEGIPEVVRKRLQAESTKEDVGDKNKAHLYVNIKLACEKHFSKQLGKNYYFDLANFGGVKNYRIHKRTTFEDFKEMVKKDFGIPKPLQRFWQYHQRANKTIRVSKPLNECGVDIKTVLDLRHFRDKTSLLDQEKTSLMTIKLFLESPKKTNITGDNLHSIQKNEILIFLKYYNPETNKLSYLGHVFVEMTSQFHMVFEKAKKMAGLDPEDEVIGFEEVKHLPSVMCTDLAPEATPERALLFQGDIIIIQKVSKNRHCEHPTVKSFLEFIQNGTKVTFRHLKNPGDEGFKLELLRTLSYDQLTAKLAKHLQIDDPQKLRLTQHNVDANMPYKHPIKYNGIETLEQMIMQNSQCTYILYYEILDMQLPYLESLKSFAIRFHNAKGERQSDHQLTLPRGRQVSDLVKALKKELGKEYSTFDMRVMQMLFSKVYKVLGPESILNNLHESYLVFRAEVIPEDQKNLRPDEYLVVFCHCRPDDNSITVFGDPMWVKVKLGETLRDVKTRVQTTLEISDEDFIRWRFAYHGSPNQPLAYLRDDDEILAKLSRLVLSGRTNGRFVGDSASFMAMVHVDK